MLKHPAPPLLATFERANSCTRVHSGSQITKQIGSRRERTSARTELHGLIKGQAIPVIALTQHPPSTKTPPKRGLCIYDSTACGGIFNISDYHIDSTGDTIRSLRGAAQCTSSLFAAATVFFGSVSSSTPSLYLAWAVASSTS